MKVPIWIIQQLLPPQLVKLGECAELENASATMRRYIAKCMTWWKEEYEETQHARIGKYKPNCKDKCSGNKPGLSFKTMGQFHCEFSNKEGDNAHVAQAPAVTHAPSAAILSNDPMEVKTPTGIEEVAHDPVSCCLDFCCCFIPSLETLNFNFVVSA